MDSIDVPIILASTSPYRKRLMERLGIPFQVAQPHCNERALKQQFTGPIEQACSFLAHAKAISILVSTPSIVIGSDQMLLWRSQAMGKPHQREVAFEMLSQLQGDVHELLTAVTVLGPKKERVDFLNKTRLKMRSLSKGQIDTYLDLDKPFDCAGSYKIEFHGIALFESIETEDFTAIEGLPLLQLSQVLEQFGCAMLHR